MIRLKFVGLAIKVIFNFTYTNMNLTLIKSQQQVKASQQSNNERLILDHKIDGAIFQFDTDTFPRIELRLMLIYNTLDVNSELRIPFLFV